ncbi:MAG: polyphosphate polymerase domain-containing protein [Vicinamibacterales bacterium]
MVHTRETRARAAEIKFLVDPSLAPRICDWARRHLLPDPHGAGPAGDEYATSSLYFDTSGFDVFHRRGSYGRAKYRVRRYGNGDHVFLERKLRQPGILIKRRTVAPLALLDRLHDATAAGSWPGDWFQRRLQVRGLSPVCQISYHRIARTIDVNHGHARLTLDSDLRAQRVSEARFTGGAGVVVLPDRMVLELKYRVQLPAIFRRLIEEFTLRTTTASKYRLGMAALGHEPIVGSRPGAPSSDAFYA